jgi:lipopolysaccharide biosynthesis glycosyltransferase
MVMLTPIIFSIHDAKGDYWPYLAVAIKSVLSGSLVKSVWVLHDHTLTQFARCQLEKLCFSQDCSINFGKVNLPTFLAHANYGPFSPASIYRLGIPQFFKEYDQIVYLDCDLVFNGVDVAEIIYAAGDAPLAAVLDPFIGRTQLHRDQLDGLGLDPAHYFNSGVLVMRPKKLRHDLIMQFQTFCKQQKVMSHPDQDFLNIQFKGLWQPLDTRFNHQVCVYDRTLFQSVSSYQGKVIHYAGKLKPLSGMLAPAFLPFWMYANGIPEVTQTFDSNAMSVLEPDPHNIDGILVRRINI